MRRYVWGLVCAAGLLLVMAATASAEYVVYPRNTSVIWTSGPDRNASALGDCVGNCGAGCSDRFNPGCGGNQYWELQLLTDPQSTGVRIDDIECYGDVCYWYQYDQMQAVSRWIYHGYFGWGCFFHDTTCPEFLWGVGCLWFAGCGNGWNQDWSYDTVVYGWQAISIQQL